MGFKVKSTVMPEQFAYQGGKWVLFRGAKGLKVIQIFLISGRAIAPDVLVVSASVHESGVDNIDGVKRMIHCSIAAWFYDCE